MSTTSLKYDTKSIRIYKQGKYGKYGKRYVLRLKAKNF